MRRLILMLLLVSCTSSESTDETDNTPDTDEDVPERRTRDGCVEACYLGDCSFVLDMPTHVQSGVVNVSGLLTRLHDLEARPAGCDDCVPLVLDPDDEGRFTIATYAEDLWDLDVVWNGGRIALAREWNATQPFPEPPELVYVDWLRDPRPSAMPLAYLHDDNGNRFPLPGPALAGPATLVTGTQALALGVAYVSSEPFVVEPGAVVDLRSVHAPVTLRFDGPRPDDGLRPDLHAFPLYLKAADRDGPVLWFWRVPSDKDTFTLPLPPRGGPWLVSSDRSMANPVLLDPDSTTEIVIPTVEVEVHVDLLSARAWLLDIMLPPQVEESEVYWDFDWVGVVPVNTWRYELDWLVEVEQRIDPEHTVIHIGEADVDLVDLDISLSMTGETPPVPINFGLLREGWSRQTRWTKVPNEGSGSIRVQPDVWELSWYANTHFTSWRSRVSRPLSVSSGAPPLHYAFHFEEVSFHAFGGTPPEPQWISGVAFNDEVAVDMMRRPLEREVRLPQGTWQVLLMNEATDGTTSIMQAPECIWVPDE